MGHARSLGTRRDGRACPQRIGTSGQGCTPAGRGGRQMKSPPFVERAGSSELSNAASPTPKPAATATNFRRFEKNTLKGFFDLELPSGLVLYDCSLPKTRDPPKDAT